MMNFKFLLLVMWIQVLVLLGAGKQARAADDFVEIIEDGTSTETDLEEARKEIFKAAVQKAAVQQIKEILGEAKFDAHKATIQGRVIANSNRYIPFVKGDEPEVKGQETKIKVRMRFSRESLRELLGKEGLLQTSENPGVVVPLIAMMDRVKNQAYRWWLGGTYGDRDPLRLHAYQVVSRLRDNLGRDGLYVANPVSWPEHFWIPQGLKKESFALEDLPMLGSVFNAQVVIRGVMNFEPKQDEPTSSQVSLRLTALSVATARPLAEITAQTTVELGASQNSSSEKVRQWLDVTIKEFTDQLADTWNRGVGRAKPVRVALRGVLTYQDLEATKAWLLKEIKSIRTLKERKFDMAGVWIEIEGLTTGQELAQSLRSVNSETQGFKVSDVRDQEVVLDVKIKR